MTDQREALPYLKLVLSVLVENEALTLDGVRAWADATILEREEPPDWLIDIAMARSLQDVEACLRGGNNGPIPDSLWAMLYAAWAREAASAPPHRVSRIAAAASAHAIYADAPKKLHPEGLINFDDEIADALDGTFGVYEDLRDEFVAALLERADRLDGSRLLRKVVLRKLPETED